MPKSELEYDTMFKAAMTWKDRAEKLGWKEESPTAVIDSLARIEAKLDALTRPSPKGPCAFPGCGDPLDPHCARHRASYCQCGRHFAQTLTNHAFEGRQ